MPSLITRTLGLSLLLGLGPSCAPERSTGTEPDAPDASSPELTAPEDPGPDPRPRSDDRRDPCDPLPREGDRCQRESSVCPISWGEPCGASTAAWCRDGVWIYEEEANLCDEDLSG